MSEQTFTPEQIKILVENKVIPKDAQPMQVSYFFEVCKRKHLDPFTKQIHMIERKERDGDNWKKSYTIQASIDGMRAIAQRNDTIHSIKRFVKKENGILYGCCEITTVKGGTFSDELSIEEYIQKKSDGTPTSFWKKMPETMIKKCAEESVLRMVSPEDLSGVYGDDEMLQADSETVLLPKPTPQLEEKYNTNTGEVHPQPETVTTNGKDVSFKVFDPKVEQITFGKFQGMEWATLNKGYLEWIVANGQPQSQQKAESTLKYLANGQSQQPVVDDLAEVFDKPVTIDDTEKKNKAMMAIAKATSKLQLNKISKSACDYMDTGEITEATFKAIGEWIAKRNEDIKRESK